MIQLTDKVWAVEVPDDVIDFKNFIKRVKDDTVVVPAGRAHFICTNKTAIEEDARKVVRELPVGARYENYNGDYPVWYHTGRDSLHSLLRSKGLDPNKNYALIEKDTTNGK